MHAVNFFLILCYHCLNAGTEAHDALERKTRETGLVVVVSLAHKGAVPPMRGRKTHTLYFTFVVERETSALGSKRVLRVPSLADPAFDILFPPSKSSPFWIEWKNRGTFLPGDLDGKVPWILISHPRPLRCLPHRTLLAAVHLAHADDGPAGTHLLHARADPSMIGVSISISLILTSQRFGGVGPPSDYLEAEQGPKKHGPRAKGIRTVPQRKSTGQKGIKTNLPTDKDVDNIYSSFLEQAEDVHWEDCARECPMPKSTCVRAGHWDDHKDFRDG
ncbi:hypothetical protein B0H11DRAFT_2241368 [Mycena galericulata]|nr:hypothetical protein B0H11DRAFT_2241368 [Mycena galericulata]